MKDLDRITDQRQNAISVDDTLKIIGCREHHKKLYALEMELAMAQQEGVFTTFGHKTTGMQLERHGWELIHFIFGIDTEILCREALKKMEDDKGVVAQFVIGKRSGPYGFGSIEVDFTSCQVSIVTTSNPIRPIDIRSVRISVIDSMVVLRIET
ncbi:hypothetical protein SAY86_006226 [Trapa natans]|uniref:Uncharacterized protein n=1 Tax=Trapa natans TaxID=22666 RepID=A0AAN7QXG4_TRANT|nr:hypothetical protein SAY86_006226 [Trapa natans]